MHRKLVVACMALAGLVAFALPATASAVNNPDLTEGVNRVAVGSTLVGTNIGTPTLETTSHGILTTCTKAILTGDVVANSGGTVQVTLTTATFAGTGAVFHNGDSECTGSFGNFVMTVKTPMCIRSTPFMAEHEFVVEGDDCTFSGTGMTFTIVSTTAGSCSYETTGPVTGTYTTSSTGDAVLTVNDTQAGSGYSKESGGFLCPSSGQMNMSFTLETHDGTSLAIS